MERLKEIAVTTFAVTLGLGAASCILALFVVPIFKAITADGKVDYCYVDTWRREQVLAPDSIEYVLYGHRRWRPDRQLAQGLSSLDAAKAESGRIGCELEPRP